ncbi:MAG: hypothetical protein EOL90_11640 [Spartobacteria bacterium]|nr:hypothetical protein [Spartobacteria bacterium]
MNLTARRAAAGKSAGLWVQSCAVLAIALGMLLAFGGAAIRLSLRLGGEPHTGGVAAGIGAYLLLAGAGAALLRRAYRRLSPRGYVAAVVASYFLAQLVLIGAGGARLRWHGDAALLHQYVQTLATHGYVPETLAPLSEAYDYQVWSRRALPFYILLHRLAGPAFPAAVQIFNAGIMALSALLTWRLGTLLFGRRTAAVALAFHLLLPWRLFTHLDLSHHVLGGFYYVLGVWILVEWHQPRRGVLPRAGLALAALLLLPLMRLEGGIDYVFAAAVAGTLALAWLMGRSSFGKTLEAFGALLVLPLLAAQLLVGPLDTRLDAADRHHHDTGILAWSTRGWSVDTGGQYYGNYEQVDILTPLALKKRTMLRIIASQAYYNPAAVAFRQLPVKAAKFFMAGYASGFEEMLQANQRPLLRALHVGARSASLLALLPLAIGGNFLLLAWLRRRDCLFFLVPFAVLVSAYIICGESDPRYSAYLHSYFFLAAGAFVVWLRDPAAREFTVRDVVAALRVPAFSLAALAGLWFAGVFTLRPHLNSFALWDLRQATVADNVPLTVSATLAPFEIRLPPQTDSPVWGTLRLPVPEDRSAIFTCYLLPQAGLSASHGTPCVLRRRTAAGWQEETLRLPIRLTLTLRPGDAPEFELRAATAPAPFPLLLGYADLEIRP